MVFLLVITTPVVDYDEELHKWNRYLNSLQLTTGLLFASLATKGLLSSLLLGNFVGCFQFLVTLVGFWLNNSHVIVSVTCSFDF